MTEPLSPDIDPRAHPAVPAARGLRQRVARKIALWLGTLIVGVVLVSVFTPTMCGCGKKAYVAYMKSDLYNLVTAEESYFGDHLSYTTALTFVPSTGVSISITFADSAGWAATASHPQTDRTCSVYVGPASLGLKGQGEGEPQCTAAHSAPTRR